MPDDLPHRLTAWAARYVRWYDGHKTAALLEEAAARILALEDVCPSCGLPHPATNPYCFCAKETCHGRER